MSEDYHIRPMTRAELDTAIGWAAAEGWNPGLDDADAFYAQDPQGFLMGFLDGRPVACISVVRYPGNFAFLGFYIVHPEHRGRGLGYRLWKAGMARLASCNVGLDGVVAQQAAYGRSGFALAHRNLRFGGRVSPERPEDARVQPLGKVAFDRLDAYDRTCFVAPREAFLRAWLHPGQRRGFAFVETGAVRGYGVLRACREGFKIGPLFADRPDVAEALFLALASEAEGAPVFLDVPEPNPEAIGLARRHGLAPVFETARMYTSGDPGLPLQRIYGITTFELG
jgi:GNAT superfamily N-acetyltransferase